MFTEQAQQLVDHAKRDAWAQGAKEISLTTLLFTCARSVEGGILLSHCLKVPVEKLRKDSPGSQSLNKRFSDKIALSAETQAVLEQARVFSMKVPDLVHPGYIGLRHIVCAFAVSHVACEALGVKALSENDAIGQLTTWNTNDIEVPEIGDLSARLQILREELLGKVFGQDHAIHAFIEGLFNAEIVAHADANRVRPRAIFVFAGPPGVGKTYLAELGARSLGRPVKQFDMSSFSDHQAYMQLVGFPPSFQGAKEGTLTGFVAQNPNAFLLFDEIEKAHLSTINLFLQILDSGRLEDKFTAEDVPFRDTTIIFMTNAGASLYDRPNETGIMSANSSFHRRTVLDALRTEKRTNTNEPLFPDAICSRMATGYPILFNHLGIHELDRIARTELDRVSRLIEEQYYKTIVYDEVLPLALVLREGANTDARTIRSQSGIFLQTEIFKLSELYTKRRLQHVWEEVDTIHIGLDPEAEKDAKALNLFEPSEKAKVLLVAAKELVDLLKEKITDVEWLGASTMSDALQILASSEVDLVLLDIWMGQDPLQVNISGTIGQFDHAPLGTHAIAEGQEFLRHLHDRLASIPVYLLSIQRDEAKVDSLNESLFLACIRSGGARGVLPLRIPKNKEGNSEDDLGAFQDQLLTLANLLYREKRVRLLGQERKVLAFDTVPNVDRAHRMVSIRLRNMRLSRAIAAEDATEMVEDVERPNVRFGDVYGADAAKDALRFVVDWLKNPRRYAALGVHPPKGILLTGLPGTGKTMLARALAGESDVAFLVASGTDFVTIWQGSGPQNVRNLFSRARRYAPSIVFIDEIDAIGRKRMGGVGGQHAEESTLNALLTEMDGFGAPTLRPVIIVAATNLADALDDALRRRFDREIEVSPPDRAARAAYLRQAFLNRASSQVTEKVIETLANRSAGETISGLRRIVNEAAVMAAQRESNLTDAIVEEAFEKMRMGEANKAPNPSTLERIARHEAGHALIGWLTGNPPVQVTIVGRGSAGGYVEKEAQEEKIIYVRSELENMICQAMGGRAAEIVYYGDKEGLSTGVASDLRMSTVWAERMIREFGMSEEIGQLFMDEQSMRNNPLSSRVSEAAERIVREQMDRAIKILSENRKSLDALSRELLEKNRLTRTELEKILPPMATEK